MLPPRLSLAIQERAKAEPRALYNANMSDANEFAMKRVEIRIPVGFLCTCFGAFLLCAVLSSPARAQTAEVSVEDASAWIAEHVVPIFAPGDQLATLSPHGCAITITVEPLPESSSADGMERYTEWFVSGEPLPGKHFALDAYGAGELDLKLVDLSSLRVTSEYTYGPPFSIFSTVNFAASVASPDEAQRLLRAIRYVATKCGAKGAPF